MPKNIVVYSDGTGQDGGVRVEQHISNVYKMYRASRVQARRFRAKYGSNCVGTDSDKDRSNAAAYFVGVFDTVAALGASGMRRFLIQAGLTLFFAGAASLTSALLAIAPSLIARYYFGLSFWWSELVVSAALVVLSVIWFLYRQRAQYTKTIYDFPEMGQKRSHQAEWRSENFDRLLSKYVGTARSANAIDERRKDFDRVAWGQRDSTQLSQFWFAGNHSDIGGSYAESESRLSDISLHWMLEEVLELSHPIKFGPVTVNGRLLPCTAAAGTPLNLYPDATAMQHSEISGTRDEIDALRERLPLIFRSLLANANYEIIKRNILDTARIHPSVKDRFALETVIDCASDGIGPYRPEALRKHPDFKQFYPDPPPVDAPPPGKTEEHPLPAQLPVG